jgi:A/G-specific adenine glycosylase
VPTTDTARVRRCLLKWYRRHRRDLPWRRRPTLYRTLVAEFMLQQTRADQVIPYYRRFLRVFPSMRKLALASPGSVLKLWEGLGYYRRAEQLQHAAQRLYNRRRPSLDDLGAVPGIGPYTRAALGSIVYGAPLPVVDGNVRRVMARILALRVPPDAPAGDRAIRRALAGWISRRRPGNWNQAMMELGARLCIPRNPQCSRCPLAFACRAHALGQTGRFPVRQRPRPRPHRHIAAAVIRRHDGRILIAQRPRDGLLPNLWEFPGGKQERGESLEACCRRELREELDISVTMGRRIARIDHAYSHYSVTLHVFDCRFAGGRPRALGCQDLRWVRIDELRHFAFPRANWPVIELLASKRGSTD